MTDQVAQSPTNYKRYKKGLPLKKFLPLIGMFVLVVGGIIAAILSQRSQDTRQQASETSITNSIVTNPTSGQTMKIGQQNRIAVIAKLQPQTSIAGIQYVAKITGQIPSDLKFEVNQIANLTVERSTLEDSDSGKLLTVVFLTPPESEFKVPSAELEIGSLIFTPTGEGNLTLTPDPNLTKVVETTNHQNILSAVQFSTFTFANTPDPSALTSGIHWETPYAYLKADDFYIETNGMKFYGKDSNIKLSSDPSWNSRTLIAEWNEHGMQMQMHIYYRLASTNQNLWYIYEIRTMDGRNPVGWRYFEGMSGNTLGNPLKHETLTLKTSNGFGTIYFKNLETMPASVATATVAPTPSPTPTPTATIAPVATPTPTPILTCNSTCRTNAQCQAVNPNWYCKIRPSCTGFTCPLGDCRLVSAPEDTTCGGSVATPTSTPSSTPTSTPSSTPTSTPSPSPTFTVAPTPTVAPLDDLYFVDEETTITYYDSVGGNEIDPSQVSMERMVAKIKFRIQNNIKKMPNPDVYVAITEYLNGAGHTSTAIQYSSIALGLDGYQGEFDLHVFSGQNPTTFRMEIDSTNKVIESNEDNNDKLFVLNFDEELECDFSSSVDFDKDCDIDLADFSFLSSRFSLSGTATEDDLLADVAGNGSSQPDGKVNLFDFSFFNSEIHRFNSVNN